MLEDVYWQKYQSRFKTFPTAIPNLTERFDMAVCIPVYAEPDILKTLESICLCHLPPCKMTVMLCFNKNETMKAEELAIHKQTWEDVQIWVNQHQRDAMHFIPFYLESLPDPKGGVGWARKIVMDEAARRLPQDGLIICLDADCTVASNYLVELYQHFSTHTDCDAAAIYFEHPYENESIAVRKAIVEYELHLRYLVHTLRWAGHPFAFQTVGSSMAVRRSAYLAHGGMNTRMAGEDFYFLQKFIEVGRLREIKTTVVYPSARISYRVPFGTGRAMNYLLSGQESWSTTSFESYKALRLLIQNIHHLRQIGRDDGLEDKEKAFSELFESHPELLSYLKSSDFFSECLKIVEQTATLSSFRKRFFRFFNAFRVMRYTHFMRDHFYPDPPIEVAVRNYLLTTEVQGQNDSETEALLHYFRNLDGEVRQ